MIPDELKRMQPMKGKERLGAKCGKCMERIAGHDNYCPNCGQAVKWDD